MMQKGALLHSSYEASARGGGALLLATGFQFTYRNGHFDWMLLHGIDADAVIRLTDTKAVEDCLDTLQHSCLLAEHSLSSTNCVQVFRLLQLAVEYVSHLHAAHSTLLEHYQRAAEAAERWKTASHTYMQLGSELVADCLSSGRISRQKLNQVDEAKAKLEALDSMYNVALDVLETEDQRLRHFHFRKQRTELNWQKVHSVNLERLIHDADPAPLEPLLHTLTYGSIGAGDERQMTPHHFAQLVPLAQCALDYVLFKANKTGRLMEQASLHLQTACSDVPALTTATMELHSQITSFLMKAQRLVDEAAAGQPQPPPQPSYSPWMAPSRPTSPCLFQRPPHQLQQQQLQPQQQPLPPHVVNGGFVGAGGVNIGRAPCDSYDAWQGMGYHHTSAGGLRGSYVPPPMPPSLLAQQSFARQAAEAAAAIAGAAATGAGPAAGYQLSRLGSPGLRPGTPQSMLAPLPTDSFGCGGGGGGLQYEERSVYLTQGGEPPLELQSRATDLHLQVEVLEQDLRIERARTDDMWRIVEGVKERLVRPEPLMGGTPFTHVSHLGVHGAGAGAGSGGGSGDGGGGGGGSAMSATSVPGSLATAAQPRLSFAQMQTMMSSAFMMDGGSSAGAGASGGDGASSSSCAVGGVAPSLPSSVYYDGSQCTPPPVTSGLEHSSLTRTKGPLDEPLLRSDERHRSMDSLNEKLSQQVTSLKQQALWQRTERRTLEVTAPPGSVLPPAPRRPPDRPSNTPTSAARLRQGAAGGANINSSTDNSPTLEGVARPLSQPVKLAGQPSSVTGQYTDVMRTVAGLPGVSLTLGLGSGNQR